jgi:DNA replication and repair protein RecF
VVFAELLDKAGVGRSLGIQKTLDGQTLVKSDGERLASLAELVRLLPVQVLHSESFELLTGAPGLRRQYLDWVLFHVEQSFFPLWRQAQRALKQRNSLIRHDKIDRFQVELWSREYARYGQQVDEMRRSCVERLQPLVSQVIASLSPELAPRVGITYSRGWAREQALEELLVTQWQRDAELGYTRSGPHRADLRLTVDHRPAADLLSRGQSKLLVSALKLAQIQLLVEHGLSCIVLIDDLPAELDRRHRKRLCAQLEALGQQTLITAIDKSDLLDCWQGADQIEMFHVEHGLATPTASNDLAATDN